jgi:hypothetical protein
MTEAERVKRALKGLRLNKPKTEAQLLFEEGLLHLRSDGFAHWKKGAFAERVERFQLRPPLGVWLRFWDGSELEVKKTWLGLKKRATSPVRPGRG